MKLLQERATQCDGKAVLPTIVRNVCRQFSSAAGQGEDRPAEIANRTALHCRPRLPFWTRVEEVLCAWLEDLIVGWQELYKTKNSCTEFSELVKKHDPDLRKPLDDSLAELRRRLEITIRNAGWTVS